MPNNSKQVNNSECRPPFGTSYIGKILINFIILIISCNPSGDKNINIKEEFHSIIGKPFFDYDEIIHYSNDITEDNIQTLYDNQFKSVLDSIKMGVILDNIPRNILDTFFIKKLSSIGYTKKKVNPTKFYKIDELFVEKPVDEGITTSCIYVYRDILILRKKK